MSIVTLVALLIAAAASLAGGALLVRGMRGRRVGDHPFCRNCGFDLFGLHPERTICPECGRNTSSPRAVLVGERHRHPRLIVGGIVLLVIGLTGLVGGLGGAMGRLDPAAWKPVWWLAAEARGGTPQVRGDALRELITRAQDGRLSTGQAQDLADTGLAHQADASATWEPLWGQFVETAETAGLLAPEQWQTYARQAVSYEFVVRPLVRLGDPAPFRLNVLPARVGPRGRLSVSIGPDEVTGGPFAEDEHSLGGRMSFTAGAGGGGSMGSTLPTHRGHAASAPPGRHVIAVRTKVEVHDGFKGPLIVEWHEQDTATFELVPPEVETVTLLDDPALKDAFTAALRVQELSQRQPNHVSVEVEMTNPPADAAFDVILRSGRRDWRVGSVSFRAGTGVSGYYTGGEVDGPLPDRIDVILRASPAAARNTVDLTQIWDGEIAIRDVPVTRAP